MQYPFGGLPHFPEAYPILLSGNAQSDSQAGDVVTVLASSTEVFNSLPSALPTFAEWLNYSAGVNFNQTQEDFDILKLPAPNLDANNTVVCTTEYGRQYYLTIQFVVLAFLVGSQVGHPTLLHFASNCTPLQALNPAQWQNLAKLQSRCMLLPLHKGRMHISQPVGTLRSCRAVK